MNEVYALKCWKISNYPLWHGKLNIQSIQITRTPATPNCFSFPFRVRVTGFYGICISQGAILIPRFGGLLWEVPAILIWFAKLILVFGTGGGLWEVVITRDGCTRRFDFNFLKNIYYKWIYINLRRNNIEELCNGAFLCCIYGDILW